jgi:hypothetical protein
MSGRTARKTEYGPVFVEDARQENGRWIVTGVVPVFTSRGSRLLDFGANNKSIAGFILPLPSSPGAAHLKWSEWLPTGREGAALPADQFSYRYRVVKSSEPIRTEVVGPFEVETIAAYFYDLADSDRKAAHSSFRVRYNGQPVPGITQADDASVIATSEGAAKTALFLTGTEPESESPCALLIDEGGTVKVVRVVGCVIPATIELMPPTDASNASSAGAPSAAAGEAATTGETGEAEAAATDESDAKKRPVPGWLDRETFATPGVYQINQALLDTRTLTVSAVPEPTP